LGSIAKKVIWRRENEFSKKLKNKKLKNKKLKIKN
jgi:hypothetical protein